MKYKIPAILWAVLLFTLSSLPSTKVPAVGFQGEDLVAHLIVYAIFGYFLAMAFNSPSASVSMKRIIVAVLIGILYAATDEYHQAFVPGRHASIADLMADSLGLIIGGLVFRRYPLGTRKTEKSQ